MSSHAAALELSQPGEVLPKLLTPKTRRWDWWSSKSTCKNCFCHPPHKTKSTQNEINLLMGNVKTTHGAYGAAPVTAGNRSHLVVDKAHSPQREKKFQREKPHSAPSFDSSSPLRPPLKVQKPESSRNPWCRRVSLWLASQDKAETILFWIQTDTPCSLLTSQWHRKQKSWHGPIKAVLLIQMYHSLD